uniref:Uncharacterized protein n=1 Tax=Chromera velia CCMP2878 TaxID=1169474 RepID=A0A0G4FUT7_9ALVE|eukprot:Cvel_18737.t1-p1 / transcript=Cvel_18737.t1 / gene=Cvel_18737 / organism=Chromera_velia_CCMP2878 / gene_product=hypothetical protein / transcript_product=hypothetical protein / location=Cvel_scaffold1571:24775-25800(-) / protein_length=342 / sequence_SO=supercontig / SO=protein_coding / is_pseudo=false
MRNGKGSAHTSRRGSVSVCGSDGTLSAFPLSERVLLQKSLQNISGGEDSAGGWRRSSSSQRAKRTGSVGSDGNLSAFPISERVMLQKSLQNIAGGRGGGGMIAQGGGMGFRDFEEEDSRARMGCRSAADCIFFIAKPITKPDSRSRKRSLQSRRTLRQTASAPSRLFTATKTNRIAVTSSCGISTAAVAPCAIPPAFSQASWEDRCREVRSRRDEKVLDVRMAPLLRMKGAEKRERERRRSAEWLKSLCAVAVCHLMWGVPQALSQLRTLAAYRRKQTATIQRRTQQATRRLRRFSTVQKPIPNLTSSLPTDFEPLVREMSPKTSNPRAVVVNLASRTRWFR